MHERSSTPVPLLVYGARMRSVRRAIEQVAATTATVLVRGESGVGKEIVAKSIHFASPRRARAFVKVNCAALPGELFESELFGYEKGAFTGAYRSKPGRFEIANRGTIFLDEIGEIPPVLQAKLLHVLEDNAFARVGASELMHVDVRVIAATNRDLQAAVHDGQFREDLYYRLNVVAIDVPPLRERTDEIPVLVNVFLRRFNEQYGADVTLSADHLGRLVEYPWPGNVRELENVIKRIAVLGNPEFVIAQLESAKLEASAPPLPASAAPPPRPVPTDLRAVARAAALEAERAAIKAALDRVQWNRAEAARLLRVSYKALLYKMDQCGLARKRDPLPADAGTEERGDRAAASA